MFHDAAAIAEEIAGIDPLLDVRWHACFGDIERNRVPQSYNDDPSIRLSRLSSVGLLLWTCRLLAELLLRSAQAASLCMVVCSVEAHKTDRKPKRSLF